MTPLSDLSLTVDRRGQLRAIAWLRWRLFSNALRTRRGKLELLSRAVIALAFAGDGRTLFTLDNSQVWRQLEADGTISLKGTVGEQYVV